MINIPEELMAEVIDIIKKLRNGSAKNMSDKEFYMMLGDFDSVYEFFIEYK